VITIKGSNTSFVQGVSYPVFGPGVVVVSGRVLDAQTIQAAVFVTPGAALGAQNVSVVTGADVVTGSGGLTVIPSQYHSPFGAALDAYVTTLYNEILNRDPEPAALNFWSGVLARGVAPATVAIDIYNSPEHRFLLVNHAAPATTLLQAYFDALNASRRAVTVFAALVPQGPSAFGPFTKTFKP
jgi:hypothetical protein